jgi:hypothetical protein
MRFARFVVVAILAVPGLLLAGRPAPGAFEGDWRTIPQRVEQWVNGESPLRQTLLSLYARARFAVLGEFPTQQMIRGKEGRYFLASHEAKGEPFRAIRLACGDNFRHYGLAVGELNLLQSHMERRGIDFRMLIVPSAPVVYRELLPDWLAQRCDLGQVPARRIMADPRLDPKVRAAMLFPLDEIRALPPSEPAYPLHYFHWIGASPRLAAGLLEHHFWGRALLPASRLPLKVQDGPSDVRHMHPGLEIEAPVGMPDFAATRIEACDGPACFPELRAIMDKVGMVARYRNPAPGLGPRLVVVGDSFAPGIAPWLSQYHSEVVLVGSNTFFTLTRAERAALRDFMFRPGSGEQVLYVYHDATLASLRVGYDLVMLPP